MTKYEVVESVTANEWNVVRVEGCGRSWEASFDTEDEAINYVFDLRAVESFESMVLE